MTRPRTLALAAIVAGLVAAPAHAHHSGAMFESERTVTFEGVVKEFQYTNPHSWLLVDVTDEDGEVTTWGFEAEGPSTLLRAGIRKSTVTPGMRITITGRPMRDGRPAAAWMNAVLEDGTVLNPSAAAWSDVFWRTPRATPTGLGISNGRAGLYAGHAHSCAIHKRPALRAGARFIGGRRVGCSSGDGLRRAEELRYVGRCDQPTKLRLPAIARRRPTSRGRMSMTHQSMNPRRWLLAAAGVACLTGAAAAEPTEAQITLRERLVDPDINMLTFRSIDEMFETIPVPAGEEVWDLPRAEAPLDFTYEFGGEAIAAGDFGGRTYTNALLILKDGAIVHERYYNFSDEQTHFLSMSTAKSITSTLIGMAAADGAIGSLDDLVIDYLPELADSGYADVTIRDALLMRSGVDWNERYDFENRTPMAMLHQNAIVENRMRFTDAALGLGDVAPPGERFNYSTVETGVLGWLLERAVGMPLPEYMSERWWKPAGMEADGFWLADGPPGVGRAVNGMGFNAVLRDFGRIGQMMLNGGVANGQRLLPESWVEEATVPSPGNEPIVQGATGSTERADTHGYQYQWWTYSNSQAYAAIGLQGQFIYVDPATDTVVVKLSYFPPGEQAASAESEAFFRAVSAWEPGAE